MATYLTSGSELVTVGGFPTGLSRPSVQFSAYGQLSGTPMIGGRVVSYAEMYRKHVWIAICANKLSRQVSRLPLKAFRRKPNGERERVRTGQLSDLMATPWPRGDAARLKQAMMLPATVYGSSALWKRRLDIGGPVAELRPLVWRMLTPYADEGGEVYLWESSQAGVPRYLDPEDVLHLGFRGLDGPLGVSPLEQLGVTASIEDAAQRHQQALLRNGARPPSAVMADKEWMDERVLSKADRQLLLDQLRVDLDTIYGGPDQQGKPALLPPGLRWEKVGHSAVEAELIDQRKLNREEVAACYDIPPPLVGILEYATLANVAEAHRMLYTTVLAPWLRMIEDALLAQLIRPESTIRGDVYLEFDLADVLKGDLLSRAKALALQISHGVLTIDEAREVENRPKFGLLETSRPLYPANNLVPVGTDAAARARSAPSDDDVGQAAEAMAHMGDDDLRFVLRGHDSVVDAILALGRREGDSHGEGYALSSNGHGPAPEDS